MHSFLRSSVATPYAGHPSLTKASLMSCQYTWNVASPTEAFSAWPYTAFLKYFTQAMSAYVLISVAGGSASHPAAGGLRLQMFLSRTVRRVISKFFDDTEVCIAGYNFPHSVGFKIFFIRSC